MESNSQQPEEALTEVSCCDRLKKLLRFYTIQFLLCIAFVSGALLLSIIFHGFHPPKSSDKNDSNNTNNSSVVPPQVCHKPSVSTFGNIRMYPFLGALLSNKPYIFLCTCVVLNDRYLLTGANCFTTSFPNLSVRLGSKFWDRYGKEYGVDSFIINGNFNTKTMKNNVALIRVDKTISMTANVKPVRLEKYFIGMRKGTVLGWNSWTVPERKDHENTRLLQQELIIHKPDWCAKYIGNQTSSTFICASLNDTLCHLDVLTGPLIVGANVVGLWSWGLACLNNPSVFTRISKLSIWFKNISSSY